MPCVSKVGSLPAQRLNYTALFVRDAYKRPSVKDNGTHLTNDFKINPASELALNLIDRMSSVIYKYPRFGKVIMFTCEKFIKASERISK